MIFRIDRFQGEWNFYNSLQRYPPWYDGGGGGGNVVAGLSSVQRLVAKPNGDSLTAYSLLGWIHNDSVATISRECLSIEPAFGGRTANAWHCNPYPKAKHSTNHNI